jgi:hypothetical protein
LNLGEILDRTFQIYRVRFLAFVCVAALPALAMRGIHLADTTWLKVHSLFRPVWTPGVYMWNFVVALGFYHIAGLLGLLAEPAHFKLASGPILDQECSLGSSLRFAAARWQGYLWIAFLKLASQLIIPELIAFGLLIAQIGLADAAGINDFTGLPSLVFLIVPVLAGCCLFAWLGACLSLAVPAAAAEKLKGFSALRRSWLLTRQARGRIFLTWLSIVIISWILLWAFQFLLRLAFSLIADANHSPLLTRTSYFPAYYVLNTGFAILIGPVYPIAVTLFYYDQRIRHEGYDIERMMEEAGMTAPSTPPGGDGPIAPAEEEIQP